MITYFYEAQSQAAEEYERRCRRRLMDELGIDAEGVDVILRLRRQVLALQVQIRKLNAQLNSYQAEQQVRVVHYRQSYAETEWYELEDE